MSEKLKVIVKTGRHARPAGMLSMELPDGAAPEGLLVDSRHPEKALPYQVVDKKLLFAMPDAPAGKNIVLEFLRDREYPGRLGRADIVEQGGRLDVIMKGKFFTSYHFTPEAAPKPYFYPVAGPRDILMTRGWPMDPQKGDDEDHPHHKSIYVAHGDINGADVWSEQEGHGYQAHGRFTRILTGAFAAGFDEELTWQDRDHKPLMTETREVRIYNTPWNIRIMDLSLSFAAEHGPVRFGDTKEGGLVSIRVASRMDGSRGGVIENAFGGTGEAECWGKPSPWVDYSGLLKGKRVGIAVFDHRDNHGHPARWHVRDYGLFALNPFALSYYKYGRETDGTLQLQHGDRLRFSFRIFIHGNNARRGQVREQYLMYAFPPETTLE
ncbi:MAG: PmoA family protein [Planctomycetes bacterium]|nr:PmoA family protein [Planctomycetota bacterium]